MKQSKGIKTYWIAVEGARTAQGGVIQAQSGRVAWARANVVRVGDLAVYPDGSIARIVSGCGAFHLDRGLALAVIGSTLHNGDVIIESPRVTWPSKTLKVRKSKDFCSQAGTALYLERATRSCSP